jgi:uncharacterized protein (DUF1015 family)
LNDLERGCCKCVNCLQTPTVVLSNDRPVCDKYSINLQNIREFVDDGVIQSLHEKSFLIYSQTVKGHRQIGICAAIAVEDCLSGTIKRHEKVTKEVVDAALAHHKGHHKFKVAENCNHFLT